MQNYGNIHTITQTSIYLLVGLNAGPIHKSLLLMHFFILYSDVF